MHGRRSSFDPMVAADQILCFSESGTITWGTFAEDVAAFEAQLDEVSDVCNMLPDRYGFMAALAASLKHSRGTVLPPHTAPEAVAAALQHAESPLVLHDRPLSLDANASGTEHGAARLFDDLRHATTPITVFTSGTTKSPRRHTKTWNILASGAAITATILRSLDLPPGRTALIGTTPHQHMYGLEATIFAALAHGYPIFRGTPFYTADFEAAREAARRAGFDSIVLVTSPAHLRYLERAVLESADVRAVISATAPLPLSLAERLEVRGDLSVMEIYGSTETGSMALRRTTDGPLWSLEAGFSLEETPSGWLAHAPHLPEPVPLGDDVSVEPDGRFSLVGRVGDMVSVHGKRISLAALNLILDETPGLKDGVVLHLPNEDGDRLAIAAVRDGAHAASDDTFRSEIRQHFDRRCDPVFIARRIVFVDALPRSPTGKISAADLTHLAEAIGFTK
ncbi:MAG: AMP-binding protein [Pseudomonadota bacterium]